MPLSFCLLLLGDICVAISNHANETDDVLQSSRMGYEVIIVDGWKASIFEGVPIDALLSQQMKKVCSVGRCASYNRSCNLVPNPTFCTYYVSLNGGSATRVYVEGNSTSVAQAMSRLSVVIDEPASATIPFAAMDQE
jgi:hypothetical protein